MARGPDNSPTIESDGSTGSESKGPLDIAGARLVSRRRFLAVAGGAAGSVLLPGSLLTSAISQDTPYPILADSVRDFSGMQGYDWWYYGYTVGQYSVDSFQTMSHFLDIGGGTYNWLADPSTFLTRLSAEGGYPNGVDVVAGRSPEVHRPVRRWVSPVSDKVLISGTLALGQPDLSADGLTGYIYAEGRLLWTESLDRQMPSVDFNIEIRVSAGMRIDFVVAPGASSTGDAFLFTAQIAQGGCSDCCFSDPPVRYRQASAPWGPLTYDHKTPADGDHTIGDVGCALTSLSMALFYAGFANDPGSLNTLLINNKGYEPKSHNLRWDDAVRAVSRSAGKNFVWVPMTTSSLAALEAVLCGGQDPTPGVFNFGFPIVVGVHRNPPAGAPFKVNHFVLVTGFRRDNLPRIPIFTIIDPASALISSLSQYNNQFSARGHVIDPPGDLSGLNVDVANADLLVADSAGRRTGFDPVLGLVNDIPESVAYSDSLGGDVSNTPAGNFSSYVSIRTPGDGRFSLIVTGVTGGVHDLSIRGYSNDGSAQPEVVVPVNVAAGQSVTVDVGYSSAPGSVPELTKTVTIKMRSEINLKSDGVVAVAILSTATFDATGVDPLSVRFGPGEAAETHRKGHIEDADGDGMADLVLHFSVQESGITEGMTEVCLTGQTVSGGSIRGCAPIQVIAG